MTDHLSTDEFERLSPEAALRSLHMCLDSFIEDFRQQQIHFAIFRNDTRGALASIRDDINSLQRRLDLLINTLQEKGAP